MVGAKRAAGGSLCDIGPWWRTSFPDGVWPVKRRCSRWPTCRRGSCCVVAPGSDSISCQRSSGAPPNLADLDVLRLPLVPRPDVRVQLQHQVALDLQVDPSKQERLERGPITLDDRGVCTEAMLEQSPQGVRHTATRLRSSHGRT